MIDRVALSAARRAADAALAHDARGHLPRAHREAIWAALGAADREGRCARARLAIAATRRVLPIWERHWPSNQLPHHLLDLAELVCRGELDGATLTEFLGETETQLDDISQGSRDKSAVGGGYAARRALATAIWDEPFDPAKLDPAVTDDDLSPELRDSAYLASVAEAGGRPEQPESNAEKRRAYWRWWLSDAVPAIAREK